MNTVIKYEVSINHKNKSGVKYTLTHNKENNTVVDDYIINDDHINVYYKKYFMKNDIENNILRYDLKVNESASHVLELCDEYFADINIKRVI